MENIISSYFVPFIRLNYDIQEHGRFSKKGLFYSPEKKNKQIHPYILIRGMLAKSPTKLVYFEKHRNLLFISWNKQTDWSVGNVMDNMEKDWFYSVDTIFKGSYRTNMFHLLNPLHLRGVHKTTQNGVILDQVVGFTKTPAGGILEFTSHLDRKKEEDNIWLFKKLSKFFENRVDLIKALRQDKLFNQLILHGPCTVELKILLNDDKYVSILFNVGIVSPRSSRVFVDYYTNLDIPKWILRRIFGVVSRVVISEDKKYLERLSKKGSDYFNDCNDKISYNHFLGLYKRFCDVYPPN